VWEKGGERFLLALFFMEYVKKQRKVDCFNTGELERARTCKKIESSGRNE